MQGDIDSPPGIQFLPHRLIFFHDFEGVFHAGDVGFAHAEGVVFLDLSRTTNKHIRNQRINYKTYKVSRDITKK